MPSKFLWGIPIPLIAQNVQSPLRASGRIVTYPFSSLKLALLAIMIFMAPLLAEGSLVINEIDYDNFSTPDHAEFIEIKNVSGNEIDFSTTPYILELINGADATSYRSINLNSGTVADGDYYVICSHTAKVNNCDLDQNADDLLQQDTEAVALKQGSALVDTVSYEGDVANYVETTGITTADVNGKSLLGLSRYPDGQDTNNNNADFQLKCVTPGTANNITANDDCYRLYLSEASITEGDSETKTLDVTVNLTHASNSPVTVKYRTEDTMSATDGEDYVAIGLTQLTFPAGNNTAQTISVTINGDEIDEGTSENFKVRLYDQSNNAQTTTVGHEIFATITDDDDAGFTVNPTTLTISEPDISKTFSIKLNSEATEEVTVDLPAMMPPDCRIDKTSLTFTPSNWNMEQIVTVTAQDDAEIDGTKSCDIVFDSFHINTTDTNYQNQVPSNITIQVEDDESPGGSITESDGNTQVGEDGLTTDSYEFVLRQPPTADVSVDLSVDLSTNFQCEITSSQALTFTAGDWDIAQTVTIKAMHDETAETAIHDCIIVHNFNNSLDTDYSSLPNKNLTVAVVDDDNAEIIIEAMEPFMVNEPDSTMDFTLKLASQPEDGKSVTIYLSTSNTQCTAPSSVTISNSDWMFGESITVTATDDSITDGEQICLVQTAPSTSDDPMYAGINPDDLTVTVMDDDIPGVDVSGSVNITEESSGNYDMALYTNPTGNVVISITSTNTSQCTVNPNLVTLNNTHNQAITVTAVDDSELEGGHSCTINHVIITSADSHYPTTMIINSKTVNIADNEHAVLFTQSNTSTDVTEGSTTDTIEVKLSTQPTDNVTVTLTPNSQIDLGEGAGTNKTLTFTNANWDTAQTVVVTAVDDSSYESNHSSTISLSASSTDGNYDSATFVVDGTVATNLSVSITDNEVAPTPTPTPTPAPTPTPSTTSPGTSIITTPIGGPIVEFSGDGSGSVTASERSTSQFSCHSSEICSTKIELGWYKFEPTADQGSEFIEWRGDNCQKGEYTTSFGGRCIAVFKKLPEPPQDTKETTKSPETPTVPKVTEPTPTPNVTDPTQTSPIPPVVTDPVKPVLVNKVGFSEQAYQASETAGKVDITVNRQGTAGSVSVDLLSSDDSGKADTHYRPIEQTLFWAKGDDTDITVPVEIIDNPEVDGNKAVILSLGNVDNAEIHLDTAVLTIEDDDKPQVIDAKPEPNVANVPIITEEPTEVESAPIEEPNDLEQDEFGLPTNTVVGSAPVNQCNTSDELIGVCHAHTQSIRYQAIGKEDSLSNGILAQPLSNEGLISNTTITPTGHLKGGKLSGYTHNEGLIEDIEFVGASLSGKNAAGEIKGTLGGQIKLASQVGGILEDVRLAPNTEIVGSGKVGYHTNRDRIAGSLIGDSEKPAILKTVHIRDKSQVANVIIEQDVTIGEEITFSDVEFRTEIVRQVTLTGQIRGTRFQNTYTKLDNVTIRANSHLTNVLIGKQVKFEEGVTLDDSVTFEVHQQHKATFGLETLPKLKGLVALDKQGKRVSTWARLEGGARMGTDASRTEGYQKKLTLKTKQPVDILGHVLTDVRHIGKRADILVVAAHTPAGATSPNVYMLDNKRKPLPWDGTLSSLVPFQSISALPALVSIPIWNNPLEIKGELQVHLGYRLADRTVVYSQGELIEITLIE